LKSVEKGIFSLIGCYIIKQLNGLNIWINNDNNSTFLFSMHLKGSEKLNSWFLAIMIHVSVLRRQKLMDLWEGSLEPEGAIWSIFN
jgi:hypothetical protein